MTSFHDLTAITTSEIEMIGLGLFGKTWQAQIAYSLSNKHGKPLSRNTLFSWHNRDSLPMNYKAKLRQLAEIRLRQVRQAYDMLNDDLSTIENSVSEFLEQNGNRLSPIASIYTRLFFGYDKYKNLVLRVELAFNKEQEMEQGKWGKFSFTEQGFLKELINLKENLIQFIVKQTAVYDPSLNITNTRYKFDEVSICHLTCLKQQPRKIG